jgi:hypothetical protein
MFELLMGVNFTMESNGINKTNNENESKSNDEITSKNISTYYLENRTYIVEQCFKKPGSFTIDNILLRLIESDYKNY